MISKLRFYNVNRLGIINFYDEAVDADYLFNIICLILNNKIRIILYVVNLM